MSAIDDVVAGGWWPLRHHATVDAALRVVRMACLVRSDAGGGAVGSLNNGRDQFGRFREVDGSAGDVQGGMIWEAASPVVPFSRAQLNDRDGPPPPRDFPSLGFVFPATVVPDDATGVTGGGQPVSTGNGSGVPGSSGSGGSTVAAGSPPPKLKTRVSLLPIQDDRDAGGNATMLADDRYAKKSVACTPGAAEGTSGVVLAAMHERRMAPLFFPTGPLKIVNRAGDPATASLVFEERADKQADPAIYARLHSAWRVVRVRDAVAPKLTRAADESGQLAWQLGGAGLDGLAGYGLGYDDSGGATTTPPSPATVLVPDQSSPTGDRLTKTTGAGASPGTTGVPQTVSPGNAGSGSGVPTTTSGPATPSTQGRGGVLGAFAWSMGGFLDPGGPGCQHELGTTHDGEKIYSGHARTSTLFRGGFDGPLLFEEFAQGKASASVPRGVQSGLPNKSRVHLCWDPDLTHDHPSGKKKGGWWWYAEAGLIAFQVDSGSNPYTAHQIDPVTHVAVRGGIVTTKLREMNNSSSVAAGTNVYAQKENFDDYVFVQGGGGGASHVAFRVASAVGAGIYNGVEIDPVLGTDVGGGITTARLQEMNLSVYVGTGTKVWAQEATSGGNDYYVFVLPMGPCT